MKTPVKLLFAATFLAAAPAVAHDAKSVHGGRVADAGTSHHFELVVGTGQVQVFVTDGNGKSLTPKGYKGTAILMANGKTQRIPLEAGDAQNLSGTTTVALPPDAKGVVQLTAPDGTTIQGQFK